MCLCLVLFLLLLSPTRHPGRVNDLIIPSLLIITGDNLAVCSSWGNITPRLLSLSATPSPWAHINAFLYQCSVIGVFKTLCIFS
jgi:hypothetical protein